MVGPTLGFEVLRLGLLAAIVGILLRLDRKHELRGGPGWRWIQAGLAVFLLEAVLDIVDEFVAPTAEVAGIGWETASEDPLLLAGLAFLTYGLARWMQLPARLRRARDEMGHRVEERTAELAESERRLRQIAEHLDSAVWLGETTGPERWDADVLYLSPGFEDIFDLPREEIEADPFKFLQAVHPDDLDRVQTELEAIDLEDSGFRIEYRIQRDDGSVRHLETKGFPIREEGEVVRLAGMTNDITDLRETEQQLRERERHLGALLGAAPAVLFALDPEGNFTLSKGQALEHLDLEPGEVVGENVFDLFGDNEDLVDMAQRALEGQRVEGTTHIAGRWWETRYNPQFDDEGDLEAVVGVSLDLTEQVEAQQEIEHQQHRYEQLTGAAARCIIELDSDGVFVEVSDRAEEVFGVPAEEIVGRTYDDPEWQIRDPQGEPVPDDELPFRQVFDTGESVDDERITVRGPGGEDRILSMYGAPIFGAGDEVEAAVFSVGDVTEEIELQQEIKRERDLRAALFEENTDPILEVVFEDGDPVVEAVNAAFREVFGYEDEEVLGEPLADLIVPPEDRSDHEAMVDKLLLGEPVQAEVVRGTKTGPRRFLGHALPLMIDGQTERAYVWYTDITELRETIRRLDRAQEVANVGDWRWDIQADEVEWSPTLYELWGIEPDQGPLGYERILDIIHPEDREAFQRAVEGALEEARAYQLAHRVVHPDGTVRWMETRGQAETGDEGQVVRLVGTSQDITELRRLGEEEAFKARLLDEVGQAVNATDEEGTIRYWNAHAEQMFGYPAEEAIGENIFELVDAHEGNRQEIMTSMRAGEEWEGELLAEHEDGSTFPAVFAKEPILDDEGNFEGMIGVSYDVSDLRQLEEEEAFKAELLSHVGQAVIATDAEGAVVYWNRHAEELYGYTPEEARGESVMELTVPDTEEGRLQAEEIMSDLSAGETWTGEFTVRRKDGSTFPALVSDSPILDDEGNVAGVIGVSQDVSEIKKAQRKLATTTNRLRSRNRELRELSQATAHGFRTPIWDTVRYLDLLQQTVGDDLSEEAHDHLETARDGARRLHDLVESLQEYLNATTREAGQGPTDAGAAVDHVLMSLSDRVEASGARVNVQNPAPELAVDETSLREVFGQLLENAIKFHGDEPPEVDITFEREDNMWVISIRDNGCGIDPEYQERVFRPFRTLHSRDEGGGPGLGLALCRGIVETHGGAIWVNSPPGEGTTMNLTLPAVGHGISEAAPENGDKEPAEIGTEAEATPDEPDLFE